MPVTTYTDAELEAMLTALESDCVERKEAFTGDAPNKVREAACAFANDLPDHRKAGVIFIGAKDNGTPSNLPITDALLLQLADIKTDGNILPPPTLTLARRTLLGSEMAVILVEPSDSPPVRYRGRIWIRIGPRRGSATAQDERILSEKRRYLDLPFDAHPLSSASLSDLSRRAFEDEYLPAAFSPEVLEENDRTYEQRLSACKFVKSAEEPIPTVLSILTIGTQPKFFVPGSYVQFLRVAGQDVTAPIVDADAIDGTIARIIQRTEDKMRSHNAVAVDFTSNDLEVRTSTYPLVALQQLFRNAVMHRSYEATNAPIQVYWFDDRIEIRNPGGPYGSVSQSNFGEPGAVDYRNPNLAESMRVQGFVQKFGFGIQLARAELKRNGNPPPQAEVSQTHVTWKIFPRS
jgi:ATP-dependent DNA helicase RecG